MVATGCGIGEELVKFSRKALLAHGRHGLRVLRPYRTTICSISCQGDRGLNEHPHRRLAVCWGSTLTVVVNGRWRLVRAGQAIAMRGDEPHRLRNESDELVRAIWFVVG